MESTISTATEKEKKVKLNSTSSLIKSIIKEWTSLSTIHSIGQIAASKNNIFRYVSYLCLIVFSSLCILQIKTTVEEFFQYKTVVNINKKERSSLTFPAIDICNLNIMNKNSILLLKNNASLIQNLFNDTDLYETLEMRNENIKSIIFAADFLYNYGAVFWSFENFFLSCHFNREKCSKEDFYYYHSYDYGACYSFNLGKTKWVRNTTEISTKFRVS
jgi:acid-sensing ion channel 1